MGQTVPTTASKLRIKVKTAERHLAYFMEIVRDDHRLGCAIPAHWKEAENTTPGLLNAAALRLSAELVWALAVLTLYSSGSDPLALEVLIHPFQ